MSPAVRRYLRELIAIAGFITIAAIVAAYILDHQRLRWPWEDVTRIEATFSTAQAVAPGQGQTVNVAGVQVGSIAEVRLENGRAVVAMDLDNEELGPVYRNATMLLRPKTGLNDMSVQLDPGTPDESLPNDGRLEDGDQLPPQSTLPNVSPDELLAALDADSRRYLTVAVNAGGEGLRDQGEQLRELLKASQPTLERTASVTGAIADRREQLERLIHNLRLLSRATVSKDDELASLVDASASVLGSIGGRERELSAAVERLPGALGATRAALHETQALATEAAPALDDLLPLARELEPALREVRPLLEDATPILRDDIRPLVREATPLVRELRPSVDDLDGVAPNLVKTGEVLNYAANELGYNPEGKEEGYLFWTGWFIHNSNAILSVEDAHGATWRGLVMVGCSSLGGITSTNELLAPLADLPICSDEPDQVR